MIIYRHVIDRIKPWIGKEKIILLTGPLFKEARLFINLLQSELGHDLPPLDRSRYDGKKPGGLLSGDGLLAISSGFVLS